MDKMDRLESMLAKLIPKDVEPVQDDKPAVAEDNENNADAAQENDLENL